jgi:iron only hydrogenase large subunit-like protein
MERLNAIYTKKRECQDCHKCIRECPVKAIRVQDGSACVVPELCIMCGNCVLTCPNGAKQVRDDLPAAKDLLRGGRRVIASLAPSFAAQYPGIRPAQLIHALKFLGFFAVSETALGAQQVSASIYALMSSASKQVQISSACPVVVDLIAKYYPECQPYVSNLLSPVLTHCKMLRAHYGEEIAIVFIGPCIAKKQEVEAHPELLDAVLTFEDLDRWLAAEKVDLVWTKETAADSFEPENAQEGALYPIDGGMAPGLTSGSEPDRVQFMSFSGIPNVKKALKEIAVWKQKENIFFELTACAGSCVNGPKARSNESVALSRYEIVHYARLADKLPRQASLEITRRYVASPVTRVEYSEVQLVEAMRTVGKYSAEDVLNCGGCGYESCREFARALIAGDAERMMCATYTRKLAQKKANALLQRMPSAVVIVDEKLKIIECNAGFTRLFSSEGELPANLEGSALGGVIPFTNLFRRVLDSGEDIMGHDIRFGRSILNTSIFTIEPHSTIGGIFQDITAPTAQKEQIIGRAQAVIEKNLKTVQQIAYLLGENAADSEVILDSIVQSFSPEDISDKDTGDGSGE